MKSDKEAVPRWIESKKHWRLDVQQDGVRKSFYSSDPRPRSGPSECRKKAAAFFAEGARDDPKLVDAWAKYAADYKRRHKLTSYNQLQGRYKAHLKVMDNRRLSSIKKADWQSVIDRAHENGAMAQKTLSGIATTIRAFCKFCAAKGFIADADVPVYFHIPATSIINKKRALQPDELRLLFQDDPDFSWWLPMFRFIVLTGIRRGEFCALQKDRDLIGDRLTIRESISHEGITTGGKTSNAQRDIYLMEDALEQVEDHIRMRKDTGQLKMLRSPYLFCDLDGGRIAPRRLRNAWQKWREAHGIEITLHELRHTFITYSRTKTSIDLDDLKEIYGHSSRMDTDGTYVHKTEEEVKEAAKREAKRRKQSKIIGEAFSRILEAK